MKLLPILLFLCYSTVLLGQEQEESQYRLRVGFQLGLAVSNVVVEDNDSIFSKDFSSKVGPSFGLRLFIRVNPFLEIKSGISHTTLGFQESIRNSFISSQSIKINTKLHYFQIPLMVKGTFIKSFNGSFYYEAGAYYGIASNASIKARSKDKDIDLSRFEVNNLNIGNSQNDFLRPSDYGLKLGMGLNFNTIDVGMTYDWGLKNISTDQSNGFSSVNRVFNIYLIFKDRLY